jgi:hypothetical protein
MAKPGEPAPPPARPVSRFLGLADCGLVLPELRLVLRHRSLLLRVRPKSGLFEQVGRVIGEQYRSHSS